MGCVVSAKLTPTVAEQQELDYIFKRFLVYKRFDDVLLFAHRVADGTAVSRLREWRVNLDSMSMFAHASGQRDQDISHIQFNVANFDGKSCFRPALFHWVHKSAYELQRATIGSKQKVEDDCNQVFELLRRSGAVTYSAAISRQCDAENNAFASASLCEYTTRMLLMEPTLRLGWNVASDICGYVPLVHFLTFAALNERLDPRPSATKIVELMSDEAINSGGALWRSVYFRTDILRALLLRPGLDMNLQPDVKLAVKKLPYQWRESVIDVFDEVAKVFTVVPEMIQDLVLARYRIDIPLPLCQIVADYYRMPYPLSFYPYPKRGSTNTQLAATAASASAAALVPATPTIHGRSNTVHPVLGCFHEW